MNKSINGLKQAFLSGISSLKGYEIRLVSWRISLMNAFNGHHIDRLFMHM